MLLLLIVQVCLVVSGTSATGSSGGSGEGSGGSGAGGVGSGERPFPPQQALSYSCWLYVERFSDADRDGHPVRLLTITRTHLQSANEKLNRRSSTLTDWFTGTFVF